MKALFITLEELKRKSIIDGNVDTDKLIQFVEVAQDTYIQTQLGTVLYDKLQTDDLESLLSGNTLVSVDRWGTFIIYYPDNKNTVAWMPKIKSKNTIEDWNIGTVTFENNKYCRQWSHWRSGKNINCWNAFEVENRVDKRAFLFTCRKGTPDGDQHIVFPGNIFNVKYEGTDNTNGTLVQDEQKVKEVLEKYFANYSK